jgi:hypothetical protein
MVLGGLAAAVLAVVALVVVGRLGSSTDEDRVLEVALAGTELAPEARATATLRETGSGVAVTLRTDGLPPAPAGFYYQAWVVGPAGAVPIGTFHQRGDEDDGSDEAVELWSGVDLADYPLLTVTIEAEDGDPASSGRRVLQASLE